MPPIGEASHPGKDQPPAQSAGGTEQKEEFYAGAVALFILAAAGGHRDFFPRLTVSRPVGRGQDVFLLHFQSLDFRLMVPVEKGFDGSDLRMQLVNMFAGVS